MTVRRLLCLCCGESIHGDEEVISRLSRCPHCQCDRHSPADLDRTVTVTLTEHELRILTMWTTNYARTLDEHCQRGVAGIVDRLGTQTTVPLTLSQELADVRAAFPDATVTVRRDGAPSNE